MKKPNNKIIIAIAAVVVLLGIIGYMQLGANSHKTTSENKNVLPQGEVIPTVDSSVQVSMVAKDSTNHDAILKIEHAPSGTQSIDYEISYLSEGTLPRGVVGTISDVTASIERDITLGTCSSGHCTYDVGVDKIHVSLKFNGSYGSESFDHDFPL